MHVARATLALVLLIGVLLAATASPARAEKEDLLARARSLVQEAKPHFDRSGDTDLDYTERKKARRTTFDLLKEARKCFDDYLDANPSQEEALDGEYVELSTMFYWTKKMMGVDELGPSRPTEPVTPEPADPGPDSGGGAEPPESGGSATPPAVPERAPEDIARDAARTRYEQILAYRAAHPGDVDGLNSLCEQFLADFEDTSLPEFEKVALLLASLKDKLAQFFKDATQADPDAIEDVDSKRIGQVVARLQKDLAPSNPPDVRARAARLLGQTRAGVASFPLVKVLGDDDPVVAKAAFEGLVAIGGGRMAENLTKTYKNSSSDDLRMKCVSILKHVAAKSPPDAKSMAMPLGDWVLSNNEQVAGDALDYLATLGPVAGPGLVEALRGSQIVQKQIEIIDKIGQVKYYRGAEQLRDYLLSGDHVKANMLREASKQALIAMGPCVVPYLIPRMMSGRHKVHTLLTLKEITGRIFGSKQAKEVREWYEENKPATGCD